MTVDVLVIHGVANRKQEEFRDRVELLRKSVGAPAGKEYRFAAAYWGDLGGGDGSGLPYALPDILGKSVRAGFEFEAIVDQVHAARDTLGHHRVRSTSFAAEAILASAQEKVAEDVGVVSTVRSDDRFGELAEAIVDAVAETRNIKKVEDPLVLAAIGRVVGAGVTVAEEGGLETRGIASDVRDSVRRIVRALDDLLGSFTGQAIGIFNQAIRGALSTAVALTFGDVNAYRDSQNGPAIRKRVLDSLASASLDPKKIDVVVAHSLGGLVALDMALAGELRIRHLMTVGSQPAMFHILKCLPHLKAFEPGKKSRLPSNTVDRWTNFWHPMDPLAFVTSKVFELADASSPVDIEVEAPLSTIVKDKLWMHSVYWESEQLVGAIRSLP